MWSEGIIGIPNEVGETISCKYQVKYYEEPSEDYGIDGGRISKLWISVNGETTASYDRGWDIEPEDEVTQLAYMILLHDYN